MALVNIDGEAVDIQQPAEKVFNFLSDFNNHEQLMPPQATNWESTADDCKFTLNGMASIGMKFDNKTPNSKITIVSNGKVPFDFKLEIDINETGDTSCSGQMKFEADLNPMMKMMVAGPMEKFFNYLTSQLQKVEY